MLKLAERWKRFSELYRKDIWQAANASGTSSHRRFHAFLRIVSITWTVFMETKTPERAAALSFSSLLGFGPLVAIAVLIGGFAMGEQGDPDYIADRIGDLVRRIAPQVDQLDEPAAAGEAVDPQLVTFINGIIMGARSGSAGFFGVVSLILIVLLLFKSVEDAFNDIWGVRVGRSLWMRVVFYWTTLTLGAVLFFGAIALLGAGAFVNVFNTSIERLPGGESLLAMLRWSLPLFSALLLVVLLTMVYRIIPNTRVFWSAALIAALVVTAFLLLNNFVALFYVRRVILTKSLYGSLALPIVLMLGLYIFWLYLLVGASISYAVQNVHFRNSQAAWSQLTESTRERLSLVVLLTIGRRFQACLPPVSASQLGTLVKVPTQILNACLQRLVEMKLITPVPPPSEDPTDDMLYQPARPLNRMTLLEFKRLDDNFGLDPTGTTLGHIDPILRHYDAAIDRMSEDPFFQKSLEELFIEHPFDESNRLA